MWIAPADFFDAVQADENTSWTVRLSQLKEILGKSWSIRICDLRRLHLNK